MAWNSVPYGRPCDSKSFIPILCSGRWNDEKGVIRRYLRNSKKQSHLCNWTSNCDKVLNIMEHLKIQKAYTKKRGGGN